VTIIRNVVTNPVPTCPKCGGKMHIVHPRGRAIDDWDSFWGCNGYPGCDGIYDISGIDKKPIVLEDNPPKWASSHWE